MKKFLNILFVLANIGISFLSNEIICSDILVKDSRSNLLVLVASFLLLITNSIYLFLRYTGFLSRGAYIACFIGNLVMWAPLWLAFTLGWMSGLTLEIYTIPYLIIQGALIAQCYFTYYFRHKLGKNKNIEKEEPKI